MGLPAPDIAQSFKLTDSFAEGIVRSTLRKVCCCSSDHSDGTSGLIAGGGKRKALYHLTVRINKTTTRMEKIISGYHMRREELAPVKGKMLVSNTSNGDRCTSTDHIDSQLTSKSYADGPVIRACVRSLMCVTPTLPSRA